MSAALYIFYLVVEVAARFVVAFEDGVEYNLHKLAAFVNNLAFFSETFYGVGMLLCVVVKTVPENVDSLGLQIVKILLKLGL